MSTVMHSTSSIPTEQYCGIPIRNIWLLMLYASDLYQQAEVDQTVDAEKNPDNIPDLIAEVLSHAVEKRLRRNLTHGYQSEHAILNRVRGRIDVLQTTTHRLLSRGVVACEYQQLTMDTPRNQYVRAALEILSRIVQRSDLKQRCHALTISLERLGVTNRKPSRTEISTLRFGRHDKEDRFLVDAAKLAFDLTIPTRAHGNQSVHALESTDQWLRKLFEKAVGGFYKTVLSRDGWQISTGRRLHWPVIQATDGIRDILPSMQLDIVLENFSQKRRIVVDTKFTAMLKQGKFGRDMLRSGYLYQIYAYLRSQSGQVDPMADSAEGVLLHPAINQRIDESIQMQDHTFRFMTVDLAASAGTFRQDLLKIVQPQF
ncbi:MAG: 5-methylcytosine-specific restriction endonuclease system specificity protein McrC [Phycisphaeraceae bacterium]|nr:5-methylcytosine-specific restriction endonuclease system specificity protein McrC [Phycisphaeraceae bacterium]